MKEKRIFLTLVFIGLIGLFSLLIIVNYQNKQQPSDSLPINQSAGAVMDYKNATYEINGTKIMLTNGLAETALSPEFASKLVTRYFGNEHVMDLDGDGREDVAFILTQETGGSGIFYYAVGAIMTDNGYVGTDGYLLGDRISPQSTDSSPNPQHKNVVVFNYVDRELNEPMTAQPSVGQSVYLKLDTENMMWGIVEPDFEGESNQSLLPTERYSAQVDRVKVIFEQWDYTRYRLQTNELVREGEMNSERGFGDDADATVYVLNWQAPEGEQIRYVRLTAEPERLYALDGYQNLIKSGPLVLEE